MYNQDLLVNLGQFPKSNELKTKDVVAGLGEIGKPILQLLSKDRLTIGYDVNDTLMDKKKFHKYEKLDTEFLHICIPFSDSFIKNVISLSSKFSTKVIVIHSTISPGTTSKLQSQLQIPVIYSATRGVHKRMLHDLKRYVKFYAIEPTAPKIKVGIFRIFWFDEKMRRKNKEDDNSSYTRIGKNNS